MISSFSDIYLRPYENLFFPIMAAKFLFPVLFCLTFCFATNLNAQCYATFRQEGINLFKKGRWIEAKVQFQEAANCKTDKPAKDDINIWLHKCNVKIEKQKQQEEEDRLRREQEEADHLYWETHKKGDISDCNEYLRAYPKGLHVSDARERITMLKKQIEARLAPFKDCSECPLMKSVEGGTYMMGSPESQIPRGKDECLHQEIVPSFAIGVYEVTVGEYLKFVDATDSHYPEWLEKGNKRNVLTGSDPYYREKGYSKTALKLPICGISWDDAVAYCDWLSKQTGKKYRLPYEKEWEYAAKGGNKSKGYLFAGGKRLSDIAWHTDNADTMPHIIGSRGANELGLYDMSGNLWEFCLNRWASYPDCAADECKGCVVIRGGSWSSKEYYCRPAARNKAVPTYKLNYYGFRCVRENK